MEKEETFEERVERVRSYFDTKEIWRKNYDSKEFKDSSQLNFELFGERLERKPRCHCVEIFFFNLNTQYKSQKVKVMSNKKFVLKPGKIVMNYNFPEPLDNNASDEDFIKLLSINAKSISLFEKYPDNWEKLAKDFKPSKKDESKKSDQSADSSTDLSKFKKVEEFEAFATKHGIDISSASNNKERLALIQEGLKPKTPAATAEKTDEEKAQERYAERQAFLIDEGWDATDDIVFSKGEHTLQKGDVWAQTDEEFKASLPTE